MSEDAISRAKELDAYFKEHKKLIGPLHGVPMSTKEHIWHKGRIANGAYVAQVDKVAPQDSHLVQLAKNAGAVFHLRTNEPQTLMVTFPCVHVTETSILTQNRQAIATITYGDRH